MREMECSVPFPMARPRLRTCSASDPAAGVNSVLGRETGRAHLESDLHDGGGGWKDGVVWRSGAEVGEK
jgi:hypothetical protein